MACLLTSRIEPTLVGAGMQWRLCSALLIMRLLLSCVSGDAGDVPSLTEQEYAVYKAVLEAEELPYSSDLRYKQSRPSVIEDKLTSHYDVATWRQNFSSGAYHELRGLDGGCLEDFLRKQALPARGRLLNEFGARVPVRMASAEALDRWRALDNPDFDFWDQFRAANPDACGLWRFSPIGYSTNHDQALVYYEFGSGGRSVHARLVLLQRDGDAWLVSAHAACWWS